MLGKIDDRRRRGQQRIKWLDGITDLMNMSEQALGVGDDAAFHGIAKSQTQLSDSTELNVTDIFKENKYY